MVATAESSETLRSLDESEDPAVMHVRFKTEIEEDGDVLEDQRDKAREDLTFIHETGGMWNDFNDSTFTGRAKMEFDMVSNFVRRFIGEWNMNRQSVTYKPDNSVTTDKDAELMTGIFRADFRDGSGKIALDNAVYEVATCGYGALLTAAVMEDEGDAENNDMRIEFRPIHSAIDLTYWDGTAERIDKLDARRVTILKAYSKSSFEENWPDFKPSSAFTPQNLNRILDSGLSSREIFYVATRYEVTIEKAKTFIYSNITSGQQEVYSEELHEENKARLEGDETIVFDRERMIKKRTIHKWVFSGDDMLEKKAIISGEFLPVIPFYGYRMFINGSEWFKGFVRDLKDACRAFNVLMNKNIENASSDGQRVMIVNPVQVENKEIDAALADPTNAAYIPLDGIPGKDGQPDHQGPVGWLEPGVLDPNSAASMQAITDFIREYTGGVPQDFMDPNTSGKALRMMMKRMNMNTQPVQDNINTGIGHLGRVYGSQASDLYTRQSIVRTLAEDGTEGRVQLIGMELDPDDDSRFIETNNLRGKKFRAYPDVGPQYESLREEGVENLKALAEFLKDMPGAEQYYPPLIAAMMENMEGVGLKAIKDVNKRIMLLQGMRKPESDEDKKILEQAQQQANQPNPQEEFLRSAAAEAQGKAKRQESGFAKDMADVDKIKAQTQEIISKIPRENAKTLSDIRKNAFANADSSKLQFGPS